MQEKYIVYLHNLSAGVSSLAKIAHITNIYPFLSCVGIEINEDKINFSDYDFIKSVAKIAKVSVCSDSVVHSSDYNFNETYDSNICVAVIDTGISNHLDFTVPQRIIKFVDMVNNKENPYDDNGHGTAVAGVICGSGIMSSGKHMGVAYKSNLVAIKAIKANGEGSTLEILQAMQWVYDNHELYNIKVVCMSFGAEATGKNDPLAMGVAALWRQGVVVVASSGNSGPEEGSIMSPGICPDIITVGGADTVHGVEHVAEFSSVGPCYGYNKPDILAPAIDIISCGTEEDYVSMSGTSISAPMVAGAAMIICAYHSNYTNDKIKEIIIKTATPMNCEKSKCGSGLLCLENIYKEITD